MTAAGFRYTPNGAGIVHHGLLRGGAADVRDPLALFERPVERGERARMSAAHSW